MKKFFKDFKTFISKGNIIDLAVAVVVGGAFGKIVTSLVNDIIMPLVSFATGGISVADWKWIIKPAEYVDGVLKVSETALHYGTFLQTILDFLIISFFIFLFIKLLMNAEKGLEKLTVSIKKLTKKEKRELRKQGLSKEEIKAIEIQKQIDVEKVAKANNAIEPAAQIKTNDTILEKDAGIKNIEPLADKTLQSTQTNSQDITMLLSEIRDLLKQNNKQQTKKDKN